MRATVTRQLLYLRCGVHGTGCDLGHRDSVDGANCIGDTDVTSSQTCAPGRMCLRHPCSVRQMCSVVAYRTQVQVGFHLLAVDLEDARPAHAPTPCWQAVKRMGRGQAVGDDLWNAIVRAAG